MRECLIAFAVPCLLGTLFAQTDLPQYIKDRQPRPCVIAPVYGPASTYQGRSWTDGTVPYDFHINVTTAEQLAMLSAMREIQRLAQIRFIRHTSEVDWILIQSSNVNSSNVGRIGGMQTINIFNWNFRFIMAHELIHALGFWHEHQRPDRDTYVTTVWTNIQANQQQNFQFPAGAAGWDAYDFDSVMHYGQFAFAINQSMPTIIVRPPNQHWQNRIGQTTHLSEGDGRGLSAAYGKNLILRESMGPKIAESNNDSDSPSISALGRYVAFYSAAGNLVANDTNGKVDVFVRDRTTNTTTRVSLSSTGQEGDKGSFHPSISADGRYVAFDSDTTNLVANDRNGKVDVFVRDREDYYPPGVNAYGLACPGLLGLPRIFTDTEPKVGNDGFALKLERVRPKAAAAGLFSPAANSLNLGGGCTLYVALPAIPIMRISDSSGRSHLPFPIPMVARLKGISFYAQGASLDSEGAWLKIASFTGGLKIVITQ